MKESTSCLWDRIATYADELFLASSAPTQFHWTHDRGDGPDVEFLGPVTGIRVIELGCGDGTNAAVLARRGACVHGVDSSGVQIARARRYWRDIDGLSFTQLDARRLDERFAAGSFDAVVSVFGAVQFAPPHTVLTQARRVLCEGGRIALSIRHPLRDDETVPGPPAPEPLRLILPAGEPVNFTVYQASVGGWLELLRQTGFTDLDAVCQPRRRDAALITNPNWDDAATLLVRGVASTEPSPMSEGSL
jgi:SAM-dependent methyltransferase